MSPDQILATAFGMTVFVAMVGLMVAMIVHEYKQ